MSWEHEMKSFKLHQKFGEEIISSMINYRRHMEDHP